MLWLFNWHVCVWHWNCHSLIKVCCFDGFKLLTRRSFLGIELPSSWKIDALFKGNHDSTTWSGSFTSEATALTVYNLFSHVYARRGPLGWLCSPGHIHTLLALEVSEFFTHFPRSWRCSPRDLRGITRYIRITSFLSEIHSFTTIEWSTLFRTQILIYGAVGWEWSGWKKPIYVFALT